MSDIAISVENLSKAYRIGPKEQRHETLVGAVSSFVRSPLENFRNLRKLSTFDDMPGNGGNGNHIQPSDVIWALKDISFEVKRGEAIGIIGRNGAGKSTLLKILSRITEPTTGQARIYGRVGSLLEVGTGFHPDLTGRENVYLNGTILGMKKREIDRRFDEIVDFSGVEKFLDTPVKRYSSGMRVRLAFSVAAHLEPEILIVDEVLAVGDAEFQKQCLGKMDEVADSGRTVLFVSHNMAAVGQLCDRCITLQGGGVHFDGGVKEGIEAYFKSIGRANSAAIVVFDGSGKQSPSKQGSIKKVEIRDESGHHRNHFGIGESFTIQIQVAFRANVPRLVMGLHFASSSGVPLLNLRSDSQSIRFPPCEAGSVRTFSVRLPGLPFYPGTYWFQPWLGELDGPRFDQIQKGISVSIECAGRYEAEQFLQQGRGIVIMDCCWNAEPS